MTRAPIPDSSVCTPAATQSQRYPSIRNPQTTIWETVEANSRLQLMWLIADLIRRARQRQSSPEGGCDESQ